MTVGVCSDIETDVPILGAALAALYLPGLPRACEFARRRAGIIESAIRRFVPPLARVGDALIDAGLVLEGRVLKDVSLIEQAGELIAAGRAISMACSGYPTRWLRQLPGSAPPALWRIGPIPAGPLFSIVGSRSLSRAESAFARDAGGAVAEAGGVVVSGGAPGADRSAVRSALDVGGGAIVLLPYGIAHCRSIPAGGCALSAAAPDAGFSSAFAMERNALIYAASARSLVVACRLREGGSWVGAAASLRRRLSEVWIREDAAKPGHRALQALGAHPLAEARLFPSAVGRADGVFLLHD